MGMISIASEVPKTEYTTKRLVKVFGGRITGEVAKNIENLGVKKRHFAFTPKGRREKVSDVCFSAFRGALKKSGLKKNDIENLIVTSDASDYLSPGLSGILAGKIDSSINHFNLQGMACIAFPRSLELASRLEGNTAIVLSGVNSGWFVNQARFLDDVKGPDEIKKLPASKRANETRKWLAVIQASLFGDGASAIIWGKGGVNVKKSSSICNIKERDYESAYFSIGQNDGFRTETIAHLDRLGEIGSLYCKEAMAKMNVNKESVGRWALHTGSRKILDSVTAELGVERQRAVESYDVLENYGNLAGASLPFIVERALKTGARSIMSLGYGWGFASCATLLRR
ncbi:MAG: hypothetical protein HZB68_00190 [Candidatus Aenigmarchaeota archaeon]|nr:hypothetical protein [Candidatus Aenigmarchaeota archaeon]